MEIPQKKSLQDLAIFMAPHSWAQLKWQVLWGPLCSSRQLSGKQSRLSQSLYALKEFATHLLGLHAHATEPGYEPAIMQMFNCALTVNAALSF